MTAARNNPALLPQSAHTKCMIAIETYTIWCRSKNLILRLNNQNFSYERMNVILSRVHSLNKTRMWFNIRGYVGEGCSVTCVCSHKIICRWWVDWTWYVDMHTTWIAWKAFILEIVETWAAGTNMSCQMNAYLKVFVWVWGMHGMHQRKRWRVMNNSLVSI